METVGKKEVKNGGEMMNMKWRVEWEKKKDTWQRYSDQISGKLLQEWRTVNGGILQIKIGTTELSLDTERMSQKSKKTGFQRKIRCVCLDSANESKFVSWEWEDENGQWRSYDLESAKTLEEVHAEGDSKGACLILHQRSYTVHLSSMEQENDATGIKRKVRRVESKAVADTTTMGEITILAHGTRKRNADTNETPSTSGSPKMIKEEVAAENLEPSSKRKKISAKEGKSSGKSDASVAKSTKKTVLVKGMAAVDAECYQKIGKSHVYFEGNDVYDVMLNQTNVQNNNNKYFLIQLLEDDASKVYSVWLRWGRVGFKGQNNLVGCGPDLEEAKNIFCKKFSDKTKNDWSDRRKFKKVPGKYDIIQVDYSAKNDEETKDKSSKKEDKDETPPAESKLDERIQKLLNLICDLNAMKQTMMELEYDAEKAPLGKLTETQIKAGFSALKKIENCIEKKDFGTKLVEACNNYYTRIPHCFGMRKPPLIRDRVALSREVELVEALDDIEVAMRTLGKGSEEEDLHPIDRHYQQMKCGLTPLEHHADEFKMVEKYMQNTHAPTHTMYKMKPRQVFACQKDGENEEFTDKGNKILLWHGSRLTNWYGILSQGLRIAPPEAPVTGYMFGKGIYFADVSSKSANYCFPTKQKNVGLVLLCEVALGKPQTLVAADYKADKLPTGCHSTKGLGMIGPDTKDDFKMNDGCVVPLGKLKETGVENPGGYTLNYNEFVVYNTSQVRMRYLVETEFVFP